MLSYDTPLFRERFFAKVACAPNSCWLWQAAKDRNGYGRIYTLLGDRRAHQVAWELHTGVPIPVGLLVLHNCPSGDNPSCVNPAHLWLGTNADNSRDASSKGQLARGLRNGAHTQPMSRAYGARNGKHTHPERIRHGEAHQNARLTESAVRDMRRLSKSGWPQRYLAARFGVAQVTVWRVLHEQAWPHVTDS